MNIDQIIGKLMGDGSVGEEKTALDAWKKEAEENIKALEDIQKIAALSNTLNGYEDFNTENAWDSFSANLEHESAIDTNTVEVKEVTTTKSATIFSIKNLAKIAAILIVVIGSLFLVNLFLNPANTEIKEQSYSAALESMNIDLSDGTNVTLDKNSDLKVLSNRKVALEGRAFFDVERDESQQFSIELPLGKVVVLGTEFTIDADDKTTEVFVKEGSVRYELEGRTYTLFAGNLVKASNSGVVMLDNEDENYNSWKNQRLIFKDNNMVEIVGALSRHFKEEIIIEDKKILSKCNLVNVFTNKSLNYILNELSESHGLEYVIKENKVFIVSAKC